MVIAIVAAATIVITNITMEAMLTNQTIRANPMIIHRQMATVIASQTAAKSLITHTNPSPLHMFTLTAITALNPKVATVTADPVRDTSPKIAIKPKNSSIATKTEVDMHRLAMATMILMTRILLSACEFSSAL